MAKFGIGVGEDFPVNDPAPRNPTPPEPEDEGGERRRHWRHHHWLHVATRLTFIALMVALIAWLFRPHGFGGYYGPYGFYPYHHHFFFPFFPGFLLLLLVLFAFRRRGCYGGHRDYWHHHDRRDRGEGA